MTTGDLSTLLVWGAATAFTVALIAYSVDLARIADRAQKRVPEAALVRRAPRHRHRRVSEAQSAPGRSVRAEGIARSTTLLGLALLFGGIVLRGIAAGRWPTANMYEFTIVGVFVAVLVLTIVQRRRVIAFVGVVVMGISVLALVARAQRVLHPGRPGAARPAELLADPARRRRDHRHRHLHRRVRRRRPPGPAQLPRGGARRGRARGRVGTGRHRFRPGSADRVRLARAGPELP